MHGARESFGAYDLMKPARPQPPTALKLARPERQTSPHPPPHDDDGPSAAESAGAEVGAPH